MKKIPRYQTTPNQFLQQKLEEIRTTNPAKFKEIVDTECPHIWGLPSFNEDGRCIGEYKCPECWQEALKDET